MLSTLRNAGPAAIRQAARPMAGRAMASKASDMGAYKHNYDAIIEQRAVAAKQELATLAEGGSASPGGSSTATSVAQSCCIVSLTSWL